MPSTSEKQRRFLFAKKGEAWTKAHGFDRLDTSAKGHKRPEHKRLVGALMKAKEK